MLLSFRTFVQSILQQQPSVTVANGKILLAVSGGIDSVVMAHLFHLSGKTCGIAHCNFGLRGDESDGDEKFVRDLAYRYQFSFHHTRFDTENFAADNKFSIQMAARKLRYQWFDELAREYRYDYIAIAHHADDVAETMLINLTRGTGPAGMHGIAASGNKIIRPLLFASRKELEEFATIEKLTWREDSSNNEDNYTRNKIRHHVIPVLKEINPAFAEAALHHARITRDYEQLVHYLIELVSPTLIRKTGGGRVTHISLEQLKQLPATATLLYHLVNAYGFSPAQCHDILESSRTGATFLSPAHKLVIGRGELVIFEKTDAVEESRYEITEADHTITLPEGELEMERQIAGTFRQQPLPDEFTSRFCAFIDAESLEFPLVIRKWKTADAFHPLGMKGRKLLSDFFTDQKFSPEQKESVLLLCNGNDVVWVIGHRIDDRYKITDHTQTIRKFTWHPYHP